MVTYNDLSAIGTSYMKDGYVFECLQESHFGTFLKILGQNKLIHDTIKEAREEVVNGKPLFRIRKL